MLIRLPPGTTYSGWWWAGRRSPDSNMTRHCLGTDTGCWCQRHQHYQWLGWWSKSSRASREGAFADSVFSRKFGFGVWHLGLRSATRDACVLLDEAIAGQRHLGNRIRRSITTRGVRRRRPKGASWQETCRCCRRLSWALIQTLYKSNWEDSTSRCAPADPYWFLVHDAGDLVRRGSARNEDRRWTSWIRSTTRWHHQYDHWARSRRSSCLQDDEGPIWWLARGLSALNLTLTRR